MPDKEPESVVIPETFWDGRPMEYMVVPATDEDGDPIPPTPAEKAAATRAANALHDPAGTPKEK